MAIFRCISCNKDYTIHQSNYFSLPCGDIFCGQCFVNIYNKKNKRIKCPLHKKEFVNDFNKFSNFFDTLTNINRNQSDEKNNEYFNDIKSRKENFLYEINTLKYKFENLKYKYLNEKNKINQYYINAKKNLEEQCRKINNYFMDLISLINEKKMQMVKEINNKEKMNLKKMENIKNILLISDEKYNFINNEFSYIYNELLNKGDYDSFYKTKKNFLKLIDNFHIYINKNIFNNNDIYNNKLINYTYPNNNFSEKEKEENIFGKIEEIPINLNNKKINSLFIPDINININKSNQNKKEKEKMGVESENINSININEGDSFIEKQLVETGNTFYLINKSNVKNVFKQQENDISHNELAINKDNINYLNKNNFIINNINNINEIKKNYYKNKINENKNRNNLLNKINNSSKKKAPYKLLNITNNNKEGNNHKKKEKIKLKNNTSNSYLISNKSNLIIKSEDNRNKMGKEKLNKKNNSIKKFYNLKNNHNSVIRGNSLNNRENISYIYTNNKNDSNSFSNNLINSYNKESQILTEINDKKKRMIESKYSCRNINKRVITRHENNKLNINEYQTKRGKSTRQKKSYSQMEILI